MTIADKDEKKDAKPAEVPAPSTKPAEAKTAVTPSKPSTPAKDISNCEDLGEYKEIA